jgi:sn-glycerol 3-phosphate transport system substrate-binding protein
MKYRLLTLLAVIALVAAACSSSSDSDGATETTVASGATETTVASGDASGDAIDVDFWVAFTDHRQVYAEDKAAEFNAAHPEYNVQVSAFETYNDVFNAAILAVDSGEPPALIHFFEAATREALDAVASSGAPIFKSVTDAVAGRSEILGEPVILDKVISAAANYYTVDGSFYSMPWNTSTTVMFSNMDMLNEAGIDTPPATWAEVTAACEAVAALSDAPSGCITWPNHGWFVEQSLGQQGVLLADNDNGRTDRATEVFLESDGIIDYIEWWKGLSDAGYYTYTGVQRDWNGTMAAYQAEEVAMLIYSSSDTSIAVGDTAFTNETSFMPRNEAVDYVGNLIGGATIWMLDGMDTTTEDGALAFLNFFSNGTNAAEWHQLTGYEPITTDGIEVLDAEGWYETAPDFRVSSDQLAAAANTPASLGALIGNFVAIRDVVTLAIEDILVNDVDVATRMAQANEEANKSLSEYEQLFGG